MKEHP